MPQSNLDEYELYLEMAIKELEVVVDVIIASPVAFVRGSKTHTDLIVAVAQQETLEDALTTYRRLRPRTPF